MDSNRKPIVWILKEQVVREVTGPRPMDYTPAYEFGEIRFITTIDPPFHPSSTIGEEWNKQFARFISQFEPLIDSIILTGAPLAIARLGRAIGEMRPAAPVRVLVWRREQGRYVPTTL